MNKITTTEYEVIKPIQLLETDKYSEVYKVTLKNHTTMLLFIYCLKLVNGISSSNSRSIYHLKTHKIFWKITSLYFQDKGRSGLVGL